jgi:hypothetical protein
MMSNIPKYDTGDVVYFRSSASRGFIEAVKISIIAKISTTWVYGIQYKMQQPQVPAIFGDRISFGNVATPQQVYYTEDEFVTYCEALSLSEAYLQQQLNSIQALIATHCGTAG